MAGLSRNFFFYFFFGLPFMPAQFSSAIGPWRRRFPKTTLEGRKETLASLLASLSLGQIQSQGKKDRVEGTRPKAGFLLCLALFSFYSYLSLEQGVCFPTARMAGTHSHSPTGKLRANVFFLSIRRYLLYMRYLEAYLRRDHCGAS